MGAPDACMHASLGYTLAFPLNGCDSDPLFSLFSCIRPCRFETEEERDQLVPMLREVARQEYLRKREEAKLKELEDELMDSKFLFDGVELTDREKADLHYKEQVGVDGSGSGSGSEGGGWTGRDIGTETLHAGRLAHMSD